MDRQNLTQVPSGWQSAASRLHATRSARVRVVRTAWVFLQAAGIGASLILISQCGKASSSGPTPIPPDPPPTAPTFVGAGDIGQCPGAAESTAALIDATPGLVFTTGDDVYGGATLAQYQRCYGPTWGRFLSRTRPTPGNHDYEGGSLMGYFQYFQGAAGPEGNGYYSYDYAGWHMVALNSVERATVGSQQLDWLEADLSASSARCTIAVLAPSALLVVEPELADHRHA